MTIKPQRNGNEKAGLNRRAFLGLAWLAVVAILIAKFVDMAVQFAKPRRQAGEFGGLFDLGPVGDLPDPGEVPVYYPKGRFWLIPLPQGLLALHNVCTHLDCLMDWDASAEEFACPCHGSMFAKDGTYIKGPAPRSLDRFVIQIVDPEGEVVAETDPSIGAPLYAGESPEDEDSEENNTLDSKTGLPDYSKMTVFVDTSRKISGELAV